jgi:hypothetical protein
MSEQVVKYESKPPVAAELMEAVLVGGDLSKLDPKQRTDYYLKVCESLGLNPLTRPFEYITLNGKLTLYAKRDATDQLRRTHDVSIEITSREMMADGSVYVVGARARMPGGRTDESTGAVAVKGLAGDALANAMLKCETKAKRRVTLSICGLGFVDETEVETIPGAVTVDAGTGEVLATKATAKPKPAPVVMAEGQALYNERANAMIQAGTLTEPEARKIVDMCAKDYGKALDVLVQKTA